MTKASQLRDMAIDELDNAIDQLNKELYALVNEVKRLKKNEQPHLIPQKKKEKARLLTIRHEKQLGISKPARGS